MHHSITNTSSFQWWAAGRTNPASHLPCHPFAPPSLLIHLCWQGRPFISLFVYLVIAVAAAASPAVADDTNTGVSTIVTVATNLINTCTDGPAVSFDGSPTVSPTTAALWVSLPLPPSAPVSTYFLALSHAPPALLRNSAIKIPVDVLNMRKDAITCAPRKGLFQYDPSNLNTNPTANGERTESSPGLTISRSAARETIATHVW
mmetsp:Transcript_25716/g.63780  ORF Transcript_25716/g.63780 Transcript_25716/m.63780 type:complete len:204 (+) Transcript_25716:217-828(+)